MRHRVREWGVTGDIAFLVHLSKRFWRMSATIFIWLVACLLMCPATWADPPLPRSVLILDQSAPIRPWSTAIIQAIQSIKSDEFGAPISYHVEHLDLFGFGGGPYDDNLLSHLAVSIGIGQLAFFYRSAPGRLISLSNCVLWRGLRHLSCLLRSARRRRRILFPPTRQVFCSQDSAHLVKAGQTLLPDLKRLVLVGDPLDGLVYYPQFAKNSPTSQKSLKSLISWVCR